MLQYSPLRDEIILLLAFACTIILLLSNFNMAGTVGQSIKWLMFGLFGIAAYVVPFIVAGSIIFMLANKDMAGVMRVKAAAVYALSVIAAAVWQRITNVPDIGESVGTYFGYCSEHKTGGGLFGGILCKLLSPLGIAGTMVILIILAIICVILITEKSFIGGIRNGGQRFVKEAREDYSAYKQHSSMVRRDEELSDEEYRAIREEERRQARIRKLEKKEQAIAAKKAREEAMSNARMNNVVRGVTNDLVIKDMQSESDNADIDIREIEPVRNDVDVYMDDIYDPLIIPKKHNTDEDDDYAQSEDDDSAYDTSDIWEIHSDTDKNAQDSNVSIAGEDISADSGYEHAGDADNYMDDDITDNVYDGYSEDYNSDIYESVNDNDVYDDEKYDDIKYNLIYAHDELLVDDDNIIIATRKYKKCLIKICLVHNFEMFKNYKLDNESLKQYAIAKGYLEEASMDDFDTENEVIIVVFRQKTEEIKKYCFINAKASKKSYEQYFIYDENHAQLLRYRELKDFDTQIEGYNTAMYFDLACVDKEAY